MTQVFQFAPPEAAEEVTKRTWEEFKDNLKTITTLDEAKQLLFLRVFDDVFEKNGAKKFYTKKLGDLQHLNFFRAANLYDQRNAPFQRYIPDGHYISDDNRFSPPGVEWLYLGIGRSSKKAKTVCIKECRGKQGDYFGLCKFKIEPTAFDILIVDLTVGLSMSYEQINQEMDDVAKKEIEKDVSLFFSTWNPKYLTDYKSIVPGMVLKWFTYTDTKMISEQLFVRVESAEKGKEYLPFQWMARYFESLGFGGIIYKSTVYSGAKNIVLFDKTNVTPVKKWEFTI